MNTTSACFRCGRPVALSDRQCAACGAPQTPTPTAQARRQRRLTAPAPSCVASSEAVMGARLLSLLPAVLIAMVRVPAVTVVAAHHQDHHQRTGEEDCNQEHLRHDNSFRSTSRVFIRNPPGVSGQNHGAARVTTDSLAAAAACGVRTASRQEPCRPRVSSLRAAGQRRAQRGAPGKGSAVSSVATGVTHDSSVS